MRGLHDGDGGDGDGNVVHLPEFDYLLLPVVCTGLQTGRWQDNFSGSKITENSFKMIKNTV